MCDKKYALLFLISSYGCTLAEGDTLKATTLLVKDNATVCGNVKVGKNLNLGSLSLGKCPRFALGSPECNVIHAGSVVGLSARLNLASPLEPVDIENLRIYTIPLFFKNPQGFVCRGKDFEVCGATISDAAQAMRGFGSYSLAVVEATVSVTFGPGFSSLPAISLLLENKNSQQDIFQECLVKPVPLAGDNVCIFWTNWQFASDVDRNGLCIHYLLYFSISGIPDNDQVLPPEVVIAFNEFVRDIINKTAINIQAVGPV